MYGKEVVMKYRLYSNSEKSSELGHDKNEDSYFFTELSIMNDKKIKLLIIADGMGGLANGDQASKNAIRGFVDYFYNAIAEKYLDANIVNYSIKYSIPDLQNILIEGIQAANRAVCEGVDTYTQTGSTISAVCMIDDCMVVANVGDSPVYFYKKKENKMQLISKLQTKAEQEVEVGLYTRNSEDYNNYSHLLYCSLGQFAKLRKDDIYVSSFGQIEDGDIILMGSDGCFGFIPEMIIKQLISDCEAEEEGFVLPQLFEMARLDKDDDQTAFMFVNVREDE